MLFPPDVANILVEYIYCMLGGGGGGGAKNKVDDIIPQL